MVEGTKGSHHKEGSKKMSKNSTVCSGIDTGKYKLDVAIDESADQMQGDNSPAGYRCLSAWLRQREVERIGIEASGGYEQAVVSFLRAGGFVVIVFQPVQVRAYAKFVLQHAKNDNIDAVLIARCTAAATDIHEPPDARLAPLAQRLTMIEQLTEDVAQLKTRREACRDTRIRAFWKQEIDRLKRLLQGELKQLVAAIREHRDLADRLDLIAAWTASARAQRSPFWCACPRSAASAANRPPPSPALLPMTMTAANDEVCDISKGDANDCGRAFTRRHCRRSSIGMPN